MRHFSYAAAFIAPFGVYTDDLIRTTARSFREGLDGQANAFANLEFRAESEEGVALLRCDGSDGVLKVEQEVGLYSLHGTIRVSMEAESPDRAKAALVRAFEQVTAEKGATILEQSFGMDDTKK
ncbi:MAG: hypothetical protein LLF75_00640 [Eubacteriales bacterium]|nr:hypothetical protein [Eubacteriales bacterium]